MINTIKMDQFLNDEDSEKDLYLVAGTTIPANGIFEEVFSNHHSFTEIKEGKRCGLHLVKESGTFLLIEKYTQGKKISSFTIESNKGELSLLISMLTGADNSLSELLLNI